MLKGPYTKTSNKDYFVPGIIDFTTRSTRPDVRDYSQVVTYTKSRIGYSQTERNAIISSQGNATTPLDAYDETLVVTPGIVEFYESFYASKVRSSYFPFDYGSMVNTVFPQQLNTDSVAEATSRFYSRLSELQTPFKGQQFLGELKETILLLKHPHKKIQELLSNFAKLKFRSSPKDIADLWLEFRFGVLPLISDVQSIMTLIENKQRFHEHDSFKVYARQASSSVNYSGYLSFPFASYMQSVTTTTYLSETFIKAGVRQEYLERSYDLSTRLLDTIDDLSDVAITAWELFPFSFLIDYFVNIGDIIQSAVVSKSSLSYTSLSTVSTIERVSEAQTFLAGAYASFNLITPPRVKQTFRRVKRLDTVAAIPPIVFSLPGSNIRYANISALLVSSLTKKGSVK